MSPLFLAPLLLLARVHGMPQPEDGECCKEKKVGGERYTLLGTDDSGMFMELSCLSNCVFEKDGLPGSKFCFGRGDMSVECHGDMMVTPPAVPGGETEGPGGETEGPGGESPPPPPVGETKAPGGETEVPGQSSSPPTVSNSSCECAAVASGSRIVGGNEVSPKYKLPYQALISPCSADGNCFLCGGTIVNKRYIVTAAHCLYSGPTADSKMTIAGGSKYRVMVGEHNQCEFDNGVNQFLLASVVHEHPDFKIDAPDVNNDIAVLKMAQDLPFSDKVAPACLPTDAAKDYSGKASTISGWGGTKANSVDNPVVQPNQCALKEGIVEVLATSNSKCSNFLGVSSSTTQLCAWAEGIDACQGDSGGPLTVAEDGKYVLLGVTSFGTGCATATPGVYTRVQGFLPWINNIIADGKCG